MSHPQPEHLRYYDVACQKEAGGSRLDLWLRRQLRRILLPMFVRNVQLIQSIVGRLDANEPEIRRIGDALRHLEQRQDELATKLPATIAFGWDYVAMTRRLAALEDQVEMLLQAQRGGATLPPNVKADRPDDHRPMSSAVACGNRAGVSN